MPEEIVVTASEFQKEFGRYQTEVVRAPIHIQRNGRAHAVLVNAEEFARLLRNDRRVYGASDLPEAWRQALRETQGAPGTEHLDALDGTA